MNAVVNNINLCLYQIRSRKADNRVIKKLGQSLRELKEMKSEEEFSKAYDSLWANDFFRNNYLVGNLFPQKINDFGRNIELEFSNDIFLELRWQLQLFEKNKDQLSIFLERKKSVDEFIINGDYKEALCLIYEIDNSLGLSLCTL